MNREKELAEESPGEYFYPLHGECGITTIPFHVPSKFLRFLNLRGAKIEEAVSYGHPPQEISVHQLSVLAEQFWCVSRAGNFLAMTGWRMQNTHVHDPTTGEDRYEERSVFNRRDIHASVSELLNKSLGVWGARD